MVQAPRVRSFTGSLAVVTAVLWASSADATTVETYVVDVVGQSGYPTYANPAPVFSFFGGRGVGLPSNGLPVGGLAGTERLTTAASGTLVDSASASGVGNSIFGPWSASGSSSASARAGRVGAEGSGTRVNIGDGNSVVGFEAFGRFTEQLRYDDPLRNGTLGRTVLHWTIDGALTSAGPSNTVGMVVNYQQNSEQIRTMFEANLQGTLPYFYALAGTGASGYTVSTSSIAGIGTFDTLPLDFVFGTSFDFTFGLLAYSMPRNGTASSQFAHTALLTGIDVYDTAGRLLSDWSITSGSGTHYDASGVHFDVDSPPAAVDEPGLEALLAAGVFGLIAMVGRRSRRGAPPVMRPVPA